MTPSKKTMTSDPQIDILKKAIKCVHGTIDFDELAESMGVANGEAMRKRFKRMFDKDDEPLHMVGSTLGGGSDGAASVKPARTPRTPKTKTATPDTGVNPATPRSKSTHEKKRKASKSDDESAKDEGSLSGPIKDDATSNDGGVVAGPESPPKKRKTSNTTSTPKSTKQSKAAKFTKVTKMTREHETGLKDNDESKVKEEDSKIGSPEVQAMVDGEIKKTEKATGGAVGEPERQAIHDGVQKKVASTVSG
ncbi:hypothetical protein LTR64_007169 [Lithohypha guttulata]|uniref:uncharacterized protein n=1 Tax=Lithohypha guttulata TaxID=1690604 RepID=UPI002DE16557|nr:hypothetical protein LTR51_004276 [Lithohypha guttulata]